MKKTLMTATVAFGLMLAGASQAQILGGSGYLAEFGIGRFYRDVRLFRLYEGTTQIQQVIIARNMVREARAA